MSRALVERTPVKKRNRTLPCCLGRYCPSSTPRKHSLPCPLRGFLPLPCCVGGLEKPAPAAQLPPDRARRFRRRGRGTNGAAFWARCPVQSLRGRSRSAHEGLRDPHETGGIAQRSPTDTRVPAVRGPGGLLAEPGAAQWGSSDRACSPGASLRARSSFQLEAAARGGRAGGAAAPAPKQLLPSRSWAKDRGAGVESKTLGLTHRLRG